MMWLQHIYACNLFSVSLSLCLTLFCNFLVFWSNFHRGGGGGGIYEKGGFNRKLTAQGGGGGVYQIRGVYLRVGIY